nr:hotdog fold domain-containing protein [Corynebacterium lactis]
MTETKTLRAWKKLSGSPVPGVGKRLFSFSASLVAPYFRTVHPQLSVMEPGRAVARMPKWWGVQNHIKSVHAIAACNLAEFTMGMLCEASVPTTHRWVPKGMTTNYKRISVGGLTAVATAELPDFADITPDTGGRDFPVHITLTDAEGTEVQDAVINCWITAKK